MKILILILAIASSSFMAGATYERMHQKSSATVATPKPIESQSTPRPFGSSLDKGAYAQRKAMKSRAVINPNPYPQ